MIKHELNNPIIYKIIRNDSTMCYYGIAYDHDLHKVFNIFVKEFIESKYFKGPYKSMFAIFAAPYKECSIELVEELYPGLTEEQIKWRLKYHIKNEKTHVIKD